MVTVQTFPSAARSPYHQVQFWRSSHIPKARIPSHHNPYLILVLLFRSAICAPLRVSEDTAKQYRSVSENGLFVFMRCWWKAKFRRGLRYFILCCMIHVTENENFHFFCCSSSVGAIQVSAGKQHRSKWSVLFIGLFNRSTRGFWIPKNSLQSNQCKAYPVPQLGRLIKWQDLCTRSDT